MQYIIIPGAFQALVALGLFFESKSKKPADALLNWMLICLVSHLSIKFVIYTFSGNLNIKVGFNTFIDLAYGPLLWAYACKIKDDAYQPLKAWYLFLPTFCAAVIYIIVIAGLMVRSQLAIKLLTLYNKATR